MIKNIFLIGLLTLPFVANAAEDVPFMGNTLQIVPLANTKIPADIQKETFNRNKEMKEKGYYETENSYAHFLLNLKRNSNDEIREYSKTKDLYDTHLKKSSNDIQLAFKFKKLPIDEQNIIGYAPIGSYVKYPEGWNGIKVFFEDKNLGVCAYEFTDLNLSHGGVQLAKEYTEYVVNKKPSSIIVQGNVGDGFTYSVVWYDSIKVNSLDCATIKYSKDITANVIKLATKIDER